MVETSNAPVFNLARTSIVKREDVDVDIYEGTKEDLLRAGIVQPDQWPPYGKKTISWSHGQQITRNCRKDETYRNINLYWGVPRISVGVPPEVRRERKIQADERRQAESAERHRKEREEQEAAKQKEREVLARRDRSDLKTMPKSEEEFRLYVIRNIRDDVMRAVARHSVPYYHHGFVITEETAEAAYMAVDALIDAVMEGGIVLDAQRQAAIIAKRRETIRAADPSFQKQFAALMTLDSSILERKQA